jgi:hypothetical protein
MLAVQRLIALALVASFAGCLPATRSTASRTCAPSEPECRVNLANHSTDDVVVYYRSAGRPQALLASVSAGRSTVVTIADPYVSGTVRLEAVSESGGRGVWCTRDVRLSEESVPDFVIVDTCNPRRNYPAPQRERPGEQPTEPTTESQIPSSGGPTTPPPGN